jgi:Ca-activated chloride channel homolog
MGAFLKRVSVIAFLGALAVGDASAQVWAASDGRFGGVLVGRSVSGGSVALPLVEEQVTVDIDFQYATTRIRQTYHNLSSEQIEGLYTLRAGPGVRAQGFAYWNGEQKIVGEVFERGVAREVYRRVTQQRRDPGLLEETGDGVFSFAVAPIQPSERKRIEVIYGQWLPRERNAVEISVPVSKPDAEINLTMWGGRDLRNISSSTHAIDVQHLSSGRYVVRSHRAVAAAGALVLRYEIADAPWTLTGFLHRDQGQDGYFALSLAAPEVARKAIAPKDVTLVIDRSGSMAGEMIRQARAASVDIIRRLRAQDRVNVIAFDHRAEKLYSEPQPLTEAVRNQTIEFVELLDDGGGTSLSTALEVALTSQHQRGDRPRVVLFFTDGKSSVQPVLDAAAADKNDVRVFTVGFGPDVNRPLLAHLAAIKRGRFKYIATAADIEKEVSSLYRQIDAPVLVDVSLEVTGGAASRVYPPTLPDLFVDDQLRISGRVRASGPVVFTLKGKAGGKPVAYRARIDAGKELRRPWVGRMWAAARVDDLSQEMALTGDRPELRDEVIDLALAYNFATPYTAFLAIPASELDGASASQLDTARMRKAEILRRRPEAIALTGDPQRGEREMHQQRSLRRSGEEAPQSAAPSADRHIALERGDGDESPLSAPSPVYGSKKRPARESKEESESSRRGAGGCASCRVGGDVAGTETALLLLAVAFVVARRRRR